MSNKIPSIHVLLLSIWHQLSSRRRLQISFFFLILIINGGLELVSLGSVLPFLTLLSDSELLWQQPLIRELSLNIGINDSSQLIFPLTLAFAVSIVLSSIFRISTLWISGRLSASIGSDLSSEAYKRTLYQPYEIHVQRNSSSIINSITTQIGSTVVAIRTTLQVANAIFTSITLLVGLFLIDAQIAFSCAFVLTSIYLLLALSSRSELRSNGYKFAIACNVLIKTIQEGLGSIRDVILDGNQSAFIAIYKKADLEQRQLKAKSVFLGTYPRYATESLGMLSIGILGVFLMLDRGNEQSVIPVLGTLAFGAQRLLPAFQQIYAGWAILRSSAPNISEVLHILRQTLPASIDPANPVELSKSFIFDDISYRYGQTQPYVLKHINFEIKSGDCVGFIGPTGSGKSTVIDLLMGLLKPSKGSLLVDGINLHSSNDPGLLNAWRASISHVPQVIFLADATIAENIAFGVPKHNIDMDRVALAASQAQIASFIESSDLGYEALVGERGVRLSGGQRQRIGIARAFYKNSKILVFDEATSALDNDTESALIDAIDHSQPDLTIVMVAHRISTLKCCNKIFSIENGQLSVVK